MTTEVNKDAATEIKNAVSALHDTIKNQDLQSAEVKDKVQRIQADLDKHEKANQELTKEILEKKAREAELQDRLETMELKFARMPSGQASAITSDEVKAFDKFSRFGMVSADAKGVNSDELKYLRTDIDFQGGYLVPPEYDANIVKEIEELSPIRTIARVMQASSGLVQVPRRTSLMGSGHTGEGVNSPGTQSNYGQVDIVVNEIDATVEISSRMLQDAVFNMEQEITQDMAESFAIEEGRQFVNGNTGFNEAEGFMTNSSVTSINSGLAADIDPAALIRLTGSIKSGYARNGTLLMNRNTITQIRLLALNTSADFWIWEPGLAKGLPNTINGHPYLEVPDMPDIAADEFPIAFGDFNRAYRIVEKPGTVMTRDQSQGPKIVRFMALRRVGGAVVLPEAIKKLKVAL